MLGLVGCAGSTPPGPAGTTTASRSTSTTSSSPLFNAIDNPRIAFGALDKTFAPKPAFYALRAAFAGRLGPVRPPTMRLFVSRGIPYATGTAPAGDGLIVNVFRAGSARPSFRAIRIPEGFRRYLVRLPSYVRSGRWLVQAIVPWSGRRREIRIG